MGLLNDAQNVADKPGELASKTLDEPPAEAVYNHGSFDGIEDREEYRAGGFHPVHLGDKLSDSGRYHVIHKLGNGGFGTVWLCRDTESGRLVALKILIASASQDDCMELRIGDWLEECRLEDPVPPVLAHIAAPLDHFWIDGPNGRHLCLVMPVLGPSIDKAWRKLTEPDKQLPKAALQASRALQFLHERGICHGGMYNFNLSDDMKNAHAIQTFDRRTFFCAHKDLTISATKISTHYSASRSAIHFFSPTAAVQVHRPRSTLSFLPVCVV